MKRNLGSVLALYPTPAVVVGTFVQEKVNWVLVAHVGIIGHNRILVSLAKPHFTNQGIKTTGRLSVNIVDESFLPTADYVGCVSGAKIDKSGVFAFHLSETGAPIIENSPLVMDCEVLDNYETDTFDNFICSISATYAEESVIDENGKISFHEKTLYTQPRLMPQCPLVVVMTFYGSIPNNGFSYTDENGTTHKFFVGLSGMDGSVEIEEY